MSKVNYEVQGYNQWQGLDITLVASTPKDALTQMLQLKNIDFKDIIKMTTKENQKCIDNGIEPWKMIDFTVEKVDSLNPVTGISNYHIVQ